MHKSKTTVIEDKQPLKLDKGEPNVSENINGLSDDELNDLKEAFDLFDADKDGSLNYEEMRRLLECIGITTEGPLLDSIVCELDIDSSKTLQYDEFLIMMTSRMNDTNTKQEYQKVFNLFLAGDTESDNKITVKHLKKIAENLNQALSDEDLLEIIKRADLNKDNAVDFEEYYSIMTKQDASKK